MVAFKCGFSSLLNDTSLCMAANATCKLDANNNQVCTNCPPGYTADFSYGHFSNCALPRLFFPVLFGILTPFFIFAFFAFVRLSLRLRGDMKKICIAAIALISSFWLWLLCVVVENGAFEATNTFAVLSTVIALIYVGLIQFVILKPVYGVLLRPMYRMSRFIIGNKVVCILTLFGAYLALQYYLRRSTYMYNLLTAIIHAIVVFFAIFEYVISALQSRNLQRLLKNSSGVEINGGRSLKPIIVRLEQLDVGFATFVIPTVVMNSLVYLFIFIVGSLPYYFIVLAVMHVSFLLTLPNIYWFLTPKPKDSSEENLRKLGNHINEIPPGPVVPSPQE